MLMKFIDNPWFNISAPLDHTEKDWNAKFAHRHIFSQERGLVSFDSADSLGWIFIFVIFD